EEENRRVGAADEDLADEVLVPGRHAGAALAAALLRAIGAEGDTLDVAAVGDGDHHVLTLDQVLVVLLEAEVGDLGPSRGGEALLDGEKLLAQDRQEALPRGEDLQVILDLR